AVALAAPAAGSPSASTNKDIAQVAASSPQFTTLVSLLKKAGLVGALKKGSYTVFAPTNAAFAKLPKATRTAVAVRGGQVYLNGTTRVTKTDVMASNGVIHVINRVLVPTS